ncbi:MAG TPA: metallophosphoesterase [Caulobacterales bacterium]|nr:metallophosphoesterase [Caulobacterales bacterium]
MHIHAQLWPALIGATLGLPLIILAGDWLMQRWKRLGRRTRWAGLGGLGFLALIYAAGLYAVWIEPNQLVVRRVEIVSPHWRGAPLTIAAVGDVHVGSPHVSASRIEKLVSRIDDLRPDMVVLLGDYVSDHRPAARRTDAEHAEIVRAMAAFAVLNAPLGVVAAMGNHDVWYGRQDLTRALQDDGVAVLWNRNVTVQRPGGAFVVAGLEDAMTGHPDFAAALDGAPSADTLVISHSPDPFPQAPANVALMLAAHTHCGQVTIPLIGRPFVPSRYGQRYACGRIDEHGHTLYVTAGVGTSMLPLRFMNPPEIVLITIRGEGG